MEADGSSKITEHVRDRVFQVNLERSRVYWDYYRSMFLVLSFCLTGLMICVTMFYENGALALAPAVGVIVLLFLCIILLAALMSLSIWRHENKHLDELISLELQEYKQAPDDRGAPLV